MTLPNSFVRDRFQADLWRVALASLLCLGLASAQGDDDGPQPLPGESRCGFCKTTGRLEVEVDSKFDVERDHGETWEVLYCSEAHEADNMALSWMPCPRCKTPSLKEAADFEWKAIQDRGKRWLDERRKTDKTAGVKKPMVHLETTHFVIAWDIPKIKTSNKRTYKAHHAAHIYGARLESIYADFQRRFGITDSNNMATDYLPGGVNKHYICVFDRRANSIPAIEKYAGTQASGGSGRRIGSHTSKFVGGVVETKVTLSYIVAWWDKGEYSSESDFFRHLTHEVIHQLTAAYYDWEWFAKTEVTVDQSGKQRFLKTYELGLLPPWLADKYGWLDAGLSHWFEKRLEGRLITYCMREQDLMSRWKGDDWHNNIYKAVIAEDAPLFADIIHIKTSALTAREHQFVWSWVDYFMRSRDDQGETEDEQGQTEDGQGETEDDKGLNLDVGLAMRLCKEEVPTRNILSQALDENMLTFDARWAEWVKKEYTPSKRKKKEGEVYRPLLPLR